MDYHSFFFNLIQSENIKIEVLNLLGSSIIKEELGDLVAGNYKKSIDVTNLPSGLYFLSLEAGNESVSRKLHISK